MIIPLFLDELESLRYELEEYSPGLSHRPSAIVANKVDLPHSEENILKLQVVDNILYRA